MTAVHLLDSQLISSALITQLSHTGLASLLCHCESTLTPTLLLGCFKEHGVLCFFCPVKFMQIKLHQKHATEQSSAQ